MVRRSEFAREALRIDVSWYRCKALPEDVAGI